MMIQQFVSRRLLSASLMGWLTIANVAQAATLPPILIFKPVCTPQILSSSQKNLELNSDELQQSVVELPAMHELLNEFQLEAATAGADALIISDYQHPGLTSGKPLSMTMDFIQFCKDDARLSSLTTRFHKISAQVTQFNYTQKMTIMVNAMPKIVEQAPQPLIQQQADHLISASKGVFGLKIGMSQAELIKRWGQPSLQLSLHKQQQLWAYGQRVWVWLAPDVQQVFTEDQLLSGFGRNLIQYHDHFDDHPWLVDGKLPYKGVVDHNLQLDPGWQRHSATAWTHRQHGQQLQLTFAAFEQKRDQIEQRLIGFNLMAATQQKAQTAKSLFAALIKYDQSAVVSWLAQLQPLQLTKPVSLNALDSIGPMDVLHHSKNGAWWLAGSYLQLQADDKNLTGLRISPSLFKDDKSAAVKNQYLSALKLPTQRQQFVKQFPQAEFFGDVLELMNGQIQMRVEFESDRPDAAVDTLEFRFHLL